MNRMNTWPAIVSVVSILSVVSIFVAGIVFLVVLVIFSGGSEAGSFVKAEGVSPRVVKYKGLDGGVVEFEHDGVRYTILNQSGGSTLLRTEKVEDYRARKAAEKHGK